MIPLQAGPLTARFDRGDVRYIRLGEREVMRRIYGSVRDHNWGTVPGVLSGFQAEIETHQFQIHYTSTHQQNEIDFIWHAEITGERDSSIRFRFEGEAKSTFRKNRIGLCLLHPIRECAGTRCRAIRADGVQLETQFPESVAAEQPVPGFQDLSGLVWEMDRGLWLEVELRGDLFEMEDQRNWIDASFKTYCTPLRLPFPAEIRAGTRITQEVRLQLRAWPEGGEPSGGASVAPALSVSTDLADAPASEPAVRIDVAGARRRLPSIGLGVASHGQPLSAREIARLSLLRLGHLRCDAKLSGTGWRDSLRLAREQAAALRIPVELAVHLAPQSGGCELAELSAELRQAPLPCARVLLFREGEKTLSRASFRTARAGLAFLEVPIGAGTDADFYQLNQFRPPFDEADFVHWSMNPQSHSFDLASLAESPAAIPAQLRSAARFFPGKPLVVSPITLKPRFNAVATGPEPPTAPEELPRPVDVRQLTAFGAAWTLAVLKHLAEGGADSVTLFETTGWRGVMEQEAGSPLPAQFPSAAGQIFPLFYAIAAVARLGNGEVIPSRSSDPLRMESLVLSSPQGDWIVLVNLTAEPQTAVVRGLGSIVRQVRLPWEAAETWQFRPENLLAAPVGAEPQRPAGTEVVEWRLEPSGMLWAQAASLT